MYIEQTTMKESSQGIWKVRIRSLATFLFKNLEKMKKN